MSRNGTYSSGKGTAFGKLESTNGKTGNCKTVDAAARADSEEDAAAPVSNRPIPAAKDRKKAAMLITKWHAARAKMITSLFMFSTP